MKWFEKILHFHETLSLDGVTLPRSVRVMHPLRESGDAIRKAMAAFYGKFYDDYSKRRLIVGINPGRFGAGVTGIPFTDTRRLFETTGFEIETADTREPSSVFIYEMISAFGGPEAFFGNYYITALCPLGFVRKNTGGREVNYNYYDDERLQRAVTPFIKTSLETQIAFGCHRDVCFCLGAGKNFRFFTSLNDQAGYFERVVPLEHPRFVMQYRLKRKKSYIRKYVQALKKPLEHPSS